MADVAAPASSSSSPSSSSLSKSVSLPTTSISSTFKWSSKYDDQLKHISETDELPSDEESYNWSDLKDAIKYKIQLTLQDSFVDIPSPILHPAAVERNSNGDKGATTAGDSFSSGSSSELSSSGSDENIPTTKEPDTLASSSSQGTTKETEEDEDVNMSFEDDVGEEITSPVIPATDGNEDVNDEEEENQANSSSIGGQEGLATTSMTISESERSGFFPAKTKAPDDRKGNWGRVLSVDETKEEMELVFGMLDDFDSSPPFTIQRLSELLLSPKLYVRSRPKYLSSLMRLLSITASHSDFPPVSPGQPPLLINNINGSAAGGGMSKGGGPFGPPSPSSEPLFSPIPFLQKKDSTAVANEIPDLDLNSSTPSTPTTTHIIPSSSSSSSSTSKPVAVSNSNSGGSIGSNSITQPLGIPVGQVDELETEAVSASNDENVHSNGDGHQMDGNVHPLTSTTTTVADQEEQEEQDTTRSSKKIRSKSPFRDDSQKVTDEQEQ
ncbi:unnamed protein product [Sympodiomycopsis kandeliae]